MTIYVCMILFLLGVTCFIFFITIIIKDRKEYFEYFNKRYNR